MFCPGPDSILDLLSGRLPDPHRRNVQGHVDACVTCRSLVDELSDSLLAPVEGDSTVMLPPPRLGDVVGRYVIDGWAGSGGMGLVFTARDSELERRVALKLVRPDRTVHGDPHALWGRLLDEARVLARVSHPNVVAIFDVGRHGDAVFLAIELVPGVTLRQWHSERPRPWREIVAKYAEAGRGLAAAHMANVVHGDFKPDNVLLGPEERVRVTDFGLASLLSAPATARDLAGTPAYMAPEQWNGGATARSDQFSFCVALYEAVHGELPLQTKARTCLPRPRVAPRFRRGCAPLSRAVSSDDRKHAMRRWTTCSTPSATTLTSAAGDVLGGSGPSLFWRPAVSCHGG